MDTNINLDEVRIMLGQRDMLIYTLERENTKLAEKTLELGEQIATLLKEKAGAGQ